MIKQHKPFQRRMTVCKGYPTTCPHAWCTNKFGVKCIMCDEYRINITGKRSYRGSHRQDGYRLTVDDLKAQTKRESGSSWKVGPDGMFYTNVKFFMPEPFWPTDGRLYLAIKPPDGMTSIPVLNMETT